MHITRKYIIDQIDSWAETLGIEGLTNDEIEQKSNVLKSEHALDCMEFLLNYLFTFKERGYFDSTPGRPIEELGLSTRTYNAIINCRFCNIRTVEDLLNLDQYRLTHIKGIGPKSLEEIREKLGRFY